MHDAGSLQTASIPCWVYTPWQIWFAPARLKWTRENLVQSCAPLWSSLGSFVRSSFFSSIATHRDNNLTYVTANSLEERTDTVHAHPNIREGFSGTFCSPGKEKDSAPASSSDNLYKRVSKRFILGGKASRTQFSFPKRLGQGKEFPRNRILSPW